MKRSDTLHPSTFGIFDTFERSAAHQAQLVSKLTPDRLVELAKMLGVHQDALVDLGLGWDGSNWTFPERDGDGNVIGFQVQTTARSKFQVKGGKRGLIIPQGLDATAGPLLLVEGPSDVAACLTLGLSAIGRPSNKGGICHLADCNLPDEVIVVGENDQKTDGFHPGLEGAMSTAKGLADRAGRRVGWALPPLGVKDIREWLNQRVNAGLDLASPSECRKAGAELLEALRSRTSWLEQDHGLALTCLQDVKEREVEWVLHRRIPAGMLSLLAGDPGFGKSTVAISVASLVSRGGYFIDGTAVPQGRVLWLTSEDDLSSVLRPKFRASGADDSRVHFIDGVRSGGEVVPFSLDTDLPKLEVALKRFNDVRLIVIDPLLSYMGEAEYGHHQEVRRVLAALKILSEQYRVAVLGITHLNKMVGGTVLQRLAGCMAFVAAARAVWVVAPHPDDRDRRLMVCAKMSVGPMPTGLEFTIEGEPPEAKWKTVPVTMTAEELFRSSLEDDAGPAVSWLSDYLSDGPRSSRDIMEDGEKAGFKPGAINRAKERMGIKPRKEGMRGGWVWALPGWKPSEDVEGAEGAGGGQLHQSATSSG